MIWRTFFRLIQGRGLSDPLAPLRAGKGIDYQMRRAHHAFFDRRRGLQRQQFIE